MSGPFPALVGLGLVTVGVLACGSAPRDEDLAPAVLVAACDVARFSRSGDPVSSRAVFLDDAHDPIHALASAASDAGDRAAAARLLEAKNAVESAEPGPTPAVADDLVGATRAALTATGSTGPLSCP